MISNLYLFLATGAFWVTLVFTGVFLFGSAPNKNRPHNHAPTTYLMSISYLIISAVSLFELLTLPESSGNSTIKISILIVASFQLILFTFINISLLDINFFSLRKLLVELAPVFLLSFFTVVSYYLNPEKTTVSVLFYLLLVYFSISVIRFGFKFFLYYSTYKKRFDNYFTETSNNSLKWIYRSYIYILLMSVIVIFNSFISGELMPAFLTLVIAFYTLHGIRFINYKNTFSTLKPVLEDVSNKSAKTPSITFIEIETALQKWESEKAYLNPKITIAHVASQISTNRTYLSQYVNSTKGKTFNEWINVLRIEEAKNIIIANKNITLEEVCEKVGYTDKSHFSKCFIKYEGMAVSKWRKSIIN